VELLVNWSRSDPALLGLYFYTTFGEPMQRFSARDLELACVV
jgi:hypothetical protein